MIEGGIIRQELRWARGVFMETQCSEGAVSRSGAELIHVQNNGRYGLHRVDSMSGSRMY
jgi:hypothetical protein